MLAGALISLVPAWLSDLERGSAGVVLEAILFFAAGLVLVRFGAPAWQTAMALIGGGIVGDLVAAVIHSGFAVYAGTWTPALALLLIIVPAVMAGVAAGDCLVRSDLGRALPLVAWVAGALAALLLGSSFIAAGAILLATALALAIRQPRRAVVLDCLLAGTTGLVACIVYFSRPAGPSRMWPIELPFQAGGLAILAAAGCAAGLLIAGRNAEHPRRGLRMSG